MTSSNCTDSTITIQLTQGRTTVIDAIDADLAQFRWTPTDSKSPYPCRVVTLIPHKPQKYRLHRIIMERILGRPLGPTEIVDHIDCDKLNNRRSNLRLTTPAGNVWNQPRRRTNKTGFKGVYVQVECNRTWYRAALVVEGKRIHLGLFNTPEEAHAAYCEAAKKYHGEFANFG